MLQAMFSGVSGLQVHQTKLDVIGNNIANVNTIGFKAGRVTFEDQLSQTIRSSASPGSSVGGTNPAQVGLGVQLGAVDTIQSQGNLQTTGKSTDLAIQGDGFFLVGSGSNVFYTRDGSFDLDSSGVLVNPANGLKLLGYVADSQGNIDTQQQITSASVLKIPIGTATSSKVTTQTAFAGNLDASSAVYSTTATFTGNVQSDPLTVTSTVFDQNGKGHAINLTLSGKTALGGGGNQWTAALTIDGTPYTTGGPFTISFNASNNETSTTLPTSLPVMGSGSGVNQAPNLTITPSYSGLMDSATGGDTAVGTTDGTSGPRAVWPTSTTVYDSIGNPHFLYYQFSRVPVQTGAPAAATSEWAWSVSEDINGTKVPLANSSTVGNAPLYFDNTGTLLDTTSQSVSFTPKGAQTLKISLDFSTLTQKSSASIGNNNGSNVQVSSQDGSPLGTLESFTITPAGLISGSYTNGQQAILGQVAMAGFSNPAGLSKQGQNLYTESSNSGLAQIGKPGVNGRGNINTGFVELSNVDLSTEFTNLIITQRGFQANTRIISTVDDLLQDVINLKR